MNSKKMAALFLLLLYICAMSFIHHCYYCCCCCYCHCQPSRVSLACWLTLVFPIQFASDNVFGWASQSAYTL